LCCLFFFNIRILITPLVSSNSSLSSSHILSSTKGSNKCPQFRNFVYKLMTLYSRLLPLSEKNNLIPYSIFDHLTFGGWGIFLFAKKSLEFNRKNIVTCKGKSILLFTRYIQTTQSSVKSIRKCKKNPYIINQNHIFFKNYYEVISG
jgi:hypothetical protein